MTKQWSDLPVDTILHCLDYHDEVKYPKRMFEKPYLDWFGKLNGQVVPLCNRFNFIETKTGSRLKYLESKKLPLFCEIKLSYEDLAKVNWELTRNHCLVIHVFLDFQLSAHVIEQIEKKWSKSNVMADIRFVGDENLLKFSFIRDREVTISVGKWGFYDDLSILLNFIQTKIKTVRLKIILHLFDYSPLDLGIDNSLELMIPYLKELHMSGVYCSIDSTIRIIQNAKLNKLTLRFKYHESAEFSHLQEMASKIVGPIQLNELVLDLNASPIQQESIVKLLEKIELKTLILKKPEIRELNETLIDVINLHRTLDKVVGWWPAVWTRLKKKVEFELDSFLK